MSLEPLAETMKDCRASALLLALCWGMTGATVIHADSGRPIGKETYSSPNGEFQLVVDPQRSAEYASNSPLITLNSATEGIVWTRTAADFEDFQFPMHATVSDDGRFVVFGGYSVHNLSWDKENQEGLRFYDHEGRLIRFIGRQDLPLGQYSISTVHWYDSERTQIEGEKLIFRTPGIEDPMEFELSTGKVLKGRVVAGQGGDHNWREWLIDRMQLSNAYSDLRAPAGEPLCWRPTDDGGCDLMVVSWFALLANPERFHGQVVQLVGFTQFEFEGNRISFSSENALHGASADALWLDVEGLSLVVAQQCNRQYCLIEAVFDAENRGHLGCCAGTLREIRRLEVQQPASESDDEF